MQYTTLLLAAASAALVSARPAPEDYSWNVTNWSAGCTRTCYYDFNITGPAVAPYPYFLATCSGRDHGAFVSCEVLESYGSSTSDPSVLSLLAPSTGDGAHLQVSLLFDNADDGYVLSW